MEKFKVYAQEEATKNFLGIRIVSSIQVTVSTADKPLAGTDAHVHLNCGSIGDFFMKKAGEKDFERAQTGTYEFDTNCTLAALRSERIVLGHDNTGKLAGWCVSHVTIRLKFAGTDDFHLYKQWDEIGWLAEDEAPYNATAVEIQKGI